MKLKYQKIAIFIDVQNLFYSAKNIYHAKVDFKKLLFNVLDNRQLTRAIAYIVVTQDVKQEHFINLMKSFGFEVKCKILKTRPDGSAKGDWDMGIAIDAISISNKVDVIALVSGDGDFTDLVNHLKAHGVRVEIHSFPRSTADELVEAATEYTPLTEETLMPFSSK